MPSPRTCITRSTHFSPPHPLQQRFLLLIIVVINIIIIINSLLLSRPAAAAAAVAAVAAAEQRLSGNMTETENRNQRAAKQQNGAAMAETPTADDVFDDSYKEKEGPKPPRRLVWRNIIMMTLLHAGALYGLVLLPSASGLTLAWSE